MYYSQITGCNTYKIQTNTTHTSGGLRIPTERKQSMCPAPFFPVYFTPTRVFRVISQGHRVLFPAHCPYPDPPSYYESHLFQHSVNFPSVKIEAVHSSETLVATYRTVPCLIPDASKASSQSLSWDFRISSGFTKIPGMVVTWLRLVVNRPLTRKVNFQSRTIPCENVCGHRGTVTGLSKQFGFSSNVLCYYLVHLPPTVQGYSITLEFDNVVK